MTGGKNGEPKAIEFDEINLGRYTAENLGEERTFLIVEDTPTDKSVIHPTRYLAITVIINATLNETKDKLILKAEVKEIEIGNIVNGEFEYENAGRMVSGPAGTGRPGPQKG